MSDRYAPEHLEVHARRPRLVARESAQLRLAVPRRGDDRRLRRQGVRARTTSCRPRAPARYRAASRSQVPEDADLAAHDAARRNARRRRRSPRASRGSRAWRRTPARPTSGCRSISRPSSSGCRRDGCSVLRPRRQGGAGDRRQLRHRPQPRAWRSPRLAPRWSRWRAPRGTGRSRARPSRRRRRGRGRAADLATTAGPTRRRRRAGGRSATPDILVNAAGVNLRQPLAEITPEAGIAPGAQPRACRSSSAARLSAA